MLLGFVRACAVANRHDVDSIFAIDRVSESTPSRQPLMPMFRTILRPLLPLLFAVATTTAWPAAFAEKTEVCWGQPALGLPDWVRNETIYEVNVRQYSEAGTFAAVQADLQRIHDLGARVLWFMPIHPIGEVERKGTLGSYYAVKDYVDVNPEFGTKADFKALVDRAKAMGFRIILDWVGNHTAWDNVMVAKHPEFFMKDHTGSYIPPLGFDWTDVIQIDFHNPAVLAWHTDAMAFWIREFGVDGFRCDYATGVPTPFWENLSAELRALKPDLFMLAEAEVPQHQRAAFHTSYSFTMMHVINEVAQGHAPATAIDAELARLRVLFPTDSSFIFYTTNHDENSWQGTVWERLGGGVRTFSVLTFALDGIPLLYNGQEAGLDKRLEFFERDPIEWKPSPLAEFYTTLCTLRREHPALATGASFTRLPTTNDAAIYAVLREAGGRKVLALLNLTARDREFTVAGAGLAGTWRDAFGGESVSLDDTHTTLLRSWGYLLLTSE
ncbi:alpha-amylase family glycosyl hydrolase [Opitutales bacterium ASA1]|nr:alpha-amylase family glycosyl hydrolase [Opitutales bacterium ASA1]